MNQGEYTHEMRGSLWQEPKERKPTAPVAKGRICVSGVNLEITMWPARTVNDVQSKAVGKTYWPISVEYPRGVTQFLAGISPAAVVVTGAQADAPVQPNVTAANDAKTDDPDVLPF